MPMLIHEAFLAELIVSSRRRNERYQKHVSRLAAADIAVMCKHKAAPPLFLTFSICSVWSCAAKRSRFRQLHPEISEPWTRPEWLQLCAGRWYVWAAVLERRQEAGRRLSDSVRAVYRRDERRGELHLYLARSLPICIVSANHPAACHPQRIFPACLLDALSGIAVAVFFSRVFFVHRPPI